MCVVCCWLLVVSCRLSLCLGCYFVFVDCCLGCVVFGCCMLRAVRCVLLCLLFVVSRLLSVVGCLSRDA